MPTITCPDCNRYVQVPNVNGSEVFDCPTCPPGAGRRKLLYKCGACMKVTMLPPGTKVCSKCSTLIRPAVRQFNQPHAPVVPSVASDWTYHTTNIKIAPSIRRHGLVSTYLRTRYDNAHPEGAFARNRDERLAEPIADSNSKHPVFQKLKQGVAYLAALGMPLATIRDLARGAIAINFVPTGGLGDAPNLSTQTDVALRALALALGLVKPPVQIDKAPQFFKVWRNVDVIKLAVLLAANPAHCLTIWADQYVTLYYRIEEMKTARNVYFLKYNCAEAGYQSYTKGVSKAMIVVLRVRRALIGGLFDDPSEDKAECTPNIVLPAIIEVFVALNPDSFVTPAVRDNPANWIGIQHWGA